MLTEVVADIGIDKPSKVYMVRVADGMVEDEGWVTVDEAKRKNALDRRRYGKVVNKYFKDKDSAASYSQEAAPPEGMGGMGGMGGEAPDMGAPPDLDTGFPAPPGDKALAGGPQGGGEPPPPMEPFDPSMPSPDEMGGMPGEEEDTGPLSDLDYSSEFDTGEEGGGEELGMPGEEEELPGMGDLGLPGEEEEQELELVVPRRIRLVPSRESKEGRRRSEINEGEDEDIPWFDGITKDRIGRKHASIGTYHCRDGDTFIATGHANIIQSGGSCHADDMTHVTLSGGECRAYENARVIQSGGECVAYNKVQVTQSGGVSTVYDKAHVSLAGGECYANDNTVVYDKGTGGRYRLFDNAEVRKREQSPVVSGTPEKPLPLRYITDLPDTAPSGAVESKEGNNLGRIDEVVPTGRPRRRHFSVDYMGRKRVFHGTHRCAEGDRIVAEQNAKIIQTGGDCVALGNAQATPVSRSGEKEEYSMNPDTTPEGVVEALLDGEIDSNGAVVLFEKCGILKKAKKAAGETYSKKGEPEKFYGTAQKISKAMRRKGKK